MSKIVDDAQLTGEQTVHVKSRDPHLSTSSI